MSYNIEAIIKFILSGQGSDGGFATYEKYPVVEPNGDWRLLPDPSPFIAANILFSLMQAKSPATNDAVKKGCEFLLSRMESGGYWRFWPYKSRQHPVPLDLDDTGVCSYVLTANGNTLTNKKALLNNCDNAGYFYTWLIPTWRNLLLHPLTSTGFARACLQALPTRMLEHYTYTDQEPAVAANALLYLRENKATQKAINTLVKVVEKGNFGMQFYHDEIMVYYHIARAYESGINGLAPLRDIICGHIEQRFEKNIESADELLRAMAAIALLCYDSNKGLAGRLIDSVGQSAYPDNWKILPYFSSKNRNFLAGSPQFTAAVFLEASIRLNAKQR
ncbi:MAG TPA: hypothetical protein VG603_06040 [Chitinophagales bacterium]|nr:hypothetical protein [Chitinophagales bacterium]